MRIETCYLTECWKDRFHKSEEKLNKCLATVLEALRNIKEVGYEPTIFLVNFFFRLETWRQGKGIYHISWNLNGPDPANHSRYAIFLPIQTIERLSSEDLMATLAHELHEIVGKLREGKLKSGTSLAEAQLIAHQRSMYDIFKEPVRSLLAKWDATLNSVKCKKVKISKTPTKTFRSNHEISNWFITHLRDHG